MSFEQIKFPECMKTLHVIMKNAYTASNQLTLHTSTKGKFDIVTNVDTFIQDYITKQLATLYPFIPLQGEESRTFDNTLETYWILDPLDGTYNYVHGSPLYGVSLALIHENQPEISAVYLPATDEFIYADLTHGCLINHKNVKLHLPNDLASSVITFGDFSTSNPSSRVLQSEIISLLCDKTKKIRINGASSIDFTNLCKGYSQGHLLFSKRPWEISPGLLIAKASGFKVKVIKVKTMTLYICIAHSLLEEMVELLSTIDPNISIFDY